MLAGKQTYRIRFQRVEEAQDDMGALERVTKNWLKRWARVVIKDTGEYHAAQGEQNLNVIECYVRTCRLTRCVQMSENILFNKSSYEIIGIDNISHPQEIKFTASFNGVTSE